MDYPFETSQSPPPPQTSLLRYVVRGGGGCTKALSETDNPSSNCASKLTDKVRRIVQSKLKQFHLQISEANYQTDNPSHTNNPSLV